jgi:hypothetical protein
MYRIKSIITGLKNIWKWRKAIYRDRDWDYWFIYQILKTKLEHQADHIEQYGMHENKTRDVAQMRDVIRLIDIVQNEKIIDEALKADKWSEELFDETDKRHNEAKKELFTKLHDGIDHWWD